MYVSWIPLKYKAYNYIFDNFILFSVFFSFSFKEISENFPKVYQLVNNYAELIEAFSSI